MGDPATAPCVYCGRDVMPPTSASHADDCPSNTGLYPVRLEDVQKRCLCGEHVCDIGLRCGECSGELKVGDHYAHLPIPGHGAWIGEIVCLMCAATMKEATDF